MRKREDSLPADQEVPMHHDVSPERAGIYGDHEAEEAFEAAKHDREYAPARRRNLKMAPSAWEKFDRIPNPALHPYHASVQRLGDLRGKVVADAGCGTGWFSVILAKRGARQVDAFDISEEAVEAARRRAEANGVADRVTALRGSMYAIPAPDAHYDLLAGQALIHHVRDKARCMAEVLRVLKPGGRAVFLEPLGSSQVLEKLRLRVPVASSAPEDPDHWRDQVTHEELEELRESVGATWSEYHFFSRLDRILSSARVLDALGRVDRMLLERVPFLRRYARAVVIEVERPAA